jgi:hypothetical protein
MTEARDPITWAHRLARVDGEERAAAVARKRAEVERRAAEARDADARWQLFERAEDERFISELRSALNRTELTFHRVEAVLVTSIELGRNETELTARRELADQLRALAKPNDRILPWQIQGKVATLDRQGYRLNRVIAVLGDRTEVPGVRVLWATEVVGVDGHEDIPFQVGDVVDVRPDLRPEQDEADLAAPF